MPRFGVSYDAGWRNRAARKSTGMGNRGIGAGAVGKVMNDDVTDWREVWALFPGDVAYVWHGSVHVSEVQDSLLAAGFVVRTHLIWAKSRMVIGRGHYHYQHEPCWYAVRKGKTSHWAGDRSQTSVWQIDKQQKSERPATRRRSRSSACAGRSRIIPRPARRSMSLSVVVAQR